MNIRELVDRAQTRTGKSQNEIAKAIGITSGSLSLFKNEKAPAADETWVKLAELAGMDPAEVLIEKHARKAGPATAAAWAKAKRGLEALKGGVSRLRIMSIMLNMLWALTTVAALLILALYHPRQRQKHENPTA